MLTLYHAWASTCAQKVRLCLAEKKLGYTGIALQLRDGEHLREEFLKINPKGLVPVLINGEAIITESTFINDYLEENFPEISLMPQDDSVCKLIRAWNRNIDLKYSDTIKIPSYQENIRPYLKKQNQTEVLERLNRIPQKETRERWLKAATTGFSENELKNAHGVLRQLLCQAEEKLSQNEWLFGNKLTLADVNTFPFIERLYTLHSYGKLQQWPAVQRWHQAIRERPAYKAANFVVQAPKLN